MVAKMESKREQSLMCGRYAITLPPEAIRQLFQTHGELPNWPMLEAAGAYRAVVADLGDAGRSQA